MLAFTPLGLIILFLSAAIFGMRLGAGKGFIAYIAAFSIFHAGEYIFSVSGSEGSGVWLFGLILGIPIALGVGAAGIFSGVSLSKGKKLVAIALVVPLASYLTYSAVVNAKIEHEFQQVTKYVLSNESVMRATDGSPITVGRFSGSYSSHGAPFRFKYEVPLYMPKDAKFPELYVLVNVSRSSSWASPTFSIECITTQRSARRDARKGACEQPGVITVLPHNPSLQARRP